MRSPFLLAAFLSAAVGCQTGPRLNRHIELLNNEKRALEDELYELEYDYEDALKDIEQLRRENAALQQRIGMPSLELSPSLRSDRPRKSKSNSGTPQLDLGPPRVDEGMLTEPKIEMPKQEPAESNLPIPKSPPPITPMTSAPASHTSTDQLHNSSFETADPRVTHIFLNPLITGGGDFDHQPGDDGLSIAVEPRNSENMFVPLAGPISVVLLDPTRTEETARIARWDLEARDAQQALQTGATVKGIQLHLPWPERAPDNNRLQLHVRYITVDGRKLDASREIFVTLPGQFSQRWTPRSSGRVAAHDDRHRNPKVDEPAVTASPISSHPLPQAEVMPASHLESTQGATRAGESSPDESQQPTTAWHPSQ